MKYLCIKYETKLIHIDIRWKIEYEQYYFM